MRQADTRRGNEEAMGRIIAETERQLAAQRSALSPQEYAATLERHVAQRLAQMAERVGASA